MQRLGFVIALTSNFDVMKEFYRDCLGLAVRTDGPFFTEFDTGPASFSLVAIRPEQKREIELCFLTANTAVEVGTLAARGVDFPAGPRSLEFGIVAHARDPEGNLISLLEPVGGIAAARDAVPGRPALGFVALGPRDVAQARAFYRDRLGLHALPAQSGGIELDAGGTRIALPARPAAGRASGVEGPLVLGFDIDDLNAWADEARARGAQFTAAPEDGDFGLAADTTDPDGNALTFREPVASPALEETLAEAYEDDGAPAAAAMRKPVKKGSKAVSRLVVKPDYKPAARPSANGRKAGRAKVKAAAARKMARASSTRGAGPAHARLKPKRAADPKRARSRPATGRLRKAELRNVARKKRAVASASKSKPVKHAATAAKARRAATRATRRASARARRG